MSSIILGIISVCVCVYGCVCVRVCVYVCLNCPDGRFGIPNVSILNISAWIGRKSLKTIRASKFQHGLEEYR